MSDVIERLRYFDGEYLRSFDFKSEQDYHREMRYRLNRQLHLTGIAGGLFLEQDQDSVPGYELFHITPGMAIDGNGREIILSQPFSLSPDTVLNKKGIKTGSNNVWLLYRETSTTPPSISYAACNQQSQNTRWLESFTVDFTPDIPGQTPTHSDGAVLLGLAQIDPGVTGLKISSVKNLRRSYVGVDAQRAVHPIFADPSLDPTNLNGTGASLIIPKLSPPDQILKDVAVDTPGPEGWFDIQAGIFGRSDLYAAGNTVLGEDFDPGINKPALTGTRGNVKISGDLMLKGKIWSAEGNQWKNLDDLIADKVTGLVPDIKIDFQDIPPDQLPGPLYQSQGTAKFQVTSGLNKSSKALILPSITRVQFAAKADLSTWFGALGGKLDVSVTGSATPSAGSQNQFDVTLTWIVNPLEAANATMRPVESVRISYVIVSFQ
jgi:hypothetical protein